MIAIDLHVHTRRYSACAELLDPLDLAQSMRRAGLQALVITEHDVLWGRDELAELNRQTAPLRVYRGVEVSAREGHVVVIGLEGVAAVKAGLPVAELAEIMRCEQAAAIWAHPPEASLRTPLKADAEVLATAIDAVEVFSTVTRNETSRAARAFARQRGIVEVAGSDAHYPEQIGAVCTVFKTLPPDETALARMIKRGEGRPMRLGRSNPGRMHHVA